jgi:hypothetical protein
LVSAATVEVGCRIAVTVPRNSSLVVVKFAVRQMEIWLLDVSVTADEGE